MSNLEIKPYIWNLKDSELTVTLMNEDGNPYGIFEQNNLYRRNSCLDNESNDLISDIQFDETFNITKYNCNEIDHRPDYMTEIQQQNTNFVLNDFDKSLSNSDKQSTVFRELMIPTEDVSVESNLVRFGPDVSPSCNCQTNDLKINVNQPLICNELLKKFSKRISKVAIKTEIKSFVKHFVRRLMNELELVNLSQNPSGDSPPNVVLHCSNTLCKEDVICNSFMQMNYDDKGNSLDNDEILVVQPFLNEILKDPTPSISRLEVNSRLKAREPSPIDVKLASDDSDYIAGILDNAYLFSKPSPKHRAVGTSPIRISEPLDPTNHKLLSLLNCIKSPQPAKHSIVGSDDKRHKLKSISGSIFQRIFHRNKSKSKETSSVASGYLTKYSKGSSISSLDKCQTSLTKSDCPRSKNDWLKIDHYSKVCEAKNLLNLATRPISRQDSRMCLPPSTRFAPVVDDLLYMSQLNVPCENTAVFIVD